MFAERLRIAFSLMAMVVIALSLSANGRGQEASPPVVDPAESPAGLDPPVTAIDPAATPAASTVDPNTPPPLVPSLDPPSATAPAAPADPGSVSPDPVVPGTITPPADPSLTPPVDPAAVAEVPAASSPTPSSPAPDVPAIKRQRPKIEPMGAPSHFKVELPPGFEGGSIKATLEAEGFDIRGSVDAEGWSRWFVTAPSEADLEQSERRLREALGPEAKVQITAYLRNVPRELAERMLTSPTRQWFFKWTSSDAPGRHDEEQLRVAEALADSTFDIRKITYSYHGASYITIQSPPAEIPKIEELVRTLVKEPRFWRPVRLEKYYAQFLPAGTSDDAPSRIAAKDRPTAIREGSVGNTTHPFLVDLPDEGLDHATLEQTLEDEGFDVLTFDFKSGPTSMRIAPPVGVDLKKAGERLSEVLGPKAEIRDELSSIPPEVAFLADLLSTRHWFFKWKGTDETDRDRVLKALDDSDVSIAELTWSRDPDGSWQVSIDSSPLDVEKIEGLIRTLVKEPKIWRPIGLAKPQNPAAAVVRPRPEVRPDDTGWHPLQVFVKGDRDRTEIVRMLNAARFDAVDVSESGDRPAHIAVAPIPDAPPAESERRLREIVGEQAAIWGSAEHSPPPEDSEFHLFSSFKWGPGTGVKWEPGAQEKDLNRVVERLVDSDLPIAVIEHDLRPDGTNWVTLIYEREAVSEIEALVRQNVQDVTLWPSRHVFIGRPDTKVPTDGPAPPNPEVEATPQSPKIAAKLLIIENDWTKANDRAAADRLARSTSQQVFDLNQAGSSLFRAGYASLFDRDEARNLTEGMQRLGLVRQTMPTGPLDLNLADEEIETLGGVQVTFSEPGSDGAPRPVAWNLLVLAQAFASRSSEANSFPQPNAPQSDPVQLRRIAVVGWTKRELTAAESGKGAPIVEEERYVGSLILRSDQSAVIPVALPGVEGLTVVLSGAKSGPIVRSLGPNGGTITQQALAAELSFDFDDLIRAYESSPIGLASVAVATMPKAREPDAEISLFWRPAQEAQIDPLASALKERYPQAEIGLKQFQAALGATLVFRAPADSAEEIQKIVQSKLPKGAIVQVGVSKDRKTDENVDEAPNATVVFHLKYIAAAEAVRLVDALKLDPRIRLVSDDRLNAVLMSAPNDTKYKHVEAVTALLQALDRKIEAGERPDPSVKGAQPDRSANAATLRMQLAAVERNVQAAAAAARGESEKLLSEKTGALRDLVTQAFRLRLDLQREEAAELRDRLAKIEENLERRERIEAVVVERRIEVLLDPALEWPDVTLAEASSPPAVAAASAPMASPEAKTNAWPADPFSPAVAGSGGFQTTGSFGSPGAQGPNSFFLTADRDPYAAATSLALRIAERNREVDALADSGDPSNQVAVKRAMLGREIELLMQEFAAREKGVQQELEAARARREAADASRQRVQTLIDVGSASASEIGAEEVAVANAERDVTTASSLLGHYSSARATFADATANAWPAADALPEGSPAPEELQGVWRQTLSQQGTNPPFRDDDSSSDTECQFLGPNLFSRQFHDGSVTIYRTVWDASASPPRIDLHMVGLSDEWAVKSYPPTLGVYEVSGDTLRIAMGGPTSGGRPASVGPGENVSYSEFERTAQRQGDTADAEVQPGLRRSEIPGERLPDAAPTTSFGAALRSNEPFDENPFFAIATSLAFRIAELQHRALAMERETPPDNARLSTVKKQIELLTLEFDARQRSLEQELAAAEARYDALQSSVKRLETLSSSGAVKPQQMISAKSEADKAERELHRHRAVVAHYARARSAFDPGSSASATNPGEDPNDAASVDPASLHGTWRVVRQSLGNDPLEMRGESTWTFDGNSLIETKTNEEGGATRYEFTIEYSPDQNGAFTRIGAAGGPWTGARRLVRFEVEGATLRLAMRNSIQATTFPDAAAPSEEDYYFEFELTADLDGRAEAEPVPPELQGTWRMTKHEILDKPDSNVPATTWVFEGDNLVVRRKGLEDLRYVVEYPDDAADEFRTFRVTILQSGPPLVERAFRYRYEIKEGALHVVQGPGDGRSLPANVAPANGGVYYEFERVNDAAELDPVAAPTVEEAVQGPQFLKQVHEFAAALRAKEQAIRETKDHLASISPADATADGVKKTIETYEREAERHRDTIRQFQFYAERACESVQAKADAATDEDEKRKLAEQFDRFAAMVLSTREIADSVGVTIEEGWRPSTGSEASAPTLNYSVEELRSEFEATNAKLNALDPSDDARRQAQDRLDWLQRTAKSQWESVRSSERELQQYVRRYQDDYFVKEKALSDTWKGDAAPDELDQATFQLAVQTSVLEQTRELADQNAREKEELGELLTEMQDERDDAGSAEAAPPGGSSPPGSMPAVGGALGR